MKYAQTFFKLFPAPKFLDVPYGGLDISDDAVRCIEYVPSKHGHTIRRYGSKALPEGVVVDGEIKNQKVLQDTIAALANELKVHVVKASLPEERMYLFKTEVTSEDEKEIRQNVEFKLEENVPLSAAESIFFFDKIPLTSSQGKGGEISVSVAPRSVILSYLDTIKAAGVSVLSFEVQAKAISRALVTCASIDTEMIVFIMNKKTGVYIVSGGVVCFTSTIPWGKMTMEESKDAQATFDELKRQLLQVQSYWAEHGHGTTIDRVVFAGQGALRDGLLSHCAAGFVNDKGAEVHFEIGKVWQNAFSYDAYIPPIPYEESLDYAVAAGLALSPMFCRQHL